MASLRNFPQISRKQRSRLSFVFLQKGWEELESNTQTEIKMGLAHFTTIHNSQNTETKHTKKKNQTKKTPLHASSLVKHWFSELLATITERHPLCLPLLSLTSLFHFRSHVTDNGCPVKIKPAQDTSEFDAHLILHLLFLPVLSL